MVISSRSGRLAVLNTRPIRPLSPMVRLRSLSPLPPKRPTVIETSVRHIRRARLPETLRTFQDRLCFEITSADMLTLSISCHNYKTPRFPIFGGDSAAPNNQLSQRCNPFIED